jgi:gluconokinase
MIVTLMGVSGCGKTAVGSALAQRLGWRFVDADSLHSAENVARMAAGIALTDADREPWLAVLQSHIADLAGRGENAVLACSALRAEFRQQLAEAGDVRYVFLRCSYEVAELRMRSRPGHFMPSNLLPSQFEALEEPADALAIDATRSVDNLVSEIMREL